MVIQRRCLACFRPHEACFCACIPTIENRTNVLILQHRRERCHPFNTARIVHKALRNSDLICDHTSNLAMRLRLRPGAGLLFPGPSAMLVSDLSPEQRPEQLVILDGTWHHAKTLVREITALQSLPRYRLALSTPSRYRIRRQPNVTALSTVEAAVSALRTLEPETEGFGQLLRAFDAMVEGQLAHLGSPNGQRFRERRNGTFKNMPLALLGDLENVVVAYGEAALGEQRCKRTTPQPISWVAQRLGSGATFSCKLIPPWPLDDVFLSHLALTRADFASAVTLDEARRRWEQFRRPRDIVAVYHPGTARLLSRLAGDREACLVLKSIDLDFNPHPRWENAFAAQEFSLGAAEKIGRAGERLAEAIAIVRGFNALGKSHLHELSAVADPVAARLSP